MPGENGVIFMILRGRKGSAKDRVQEDCLPRWKGADDLSQQELSKQGCRGAFPRSLRASEPCAAAVAREMGAAPGQAPRGLRRRRSGCEISEGNRNSSPDFSGMVPGSGGGDASHSS